MANKMTKKDIVNMMLADEAIKANQVYVDFLAHELELLNKKSTTKKSAKDSETNEALKIAILDVLATLKSGSVSEIQKQNTDLSVLSNQKVSSLLKSLVEDGQVVKTTDKKKSVFSLKK
jgi:DNA-binding HxlR family transcriptional regulator